MLRRAGAFAAVAVLAGAAPQPAVAGAAHARHTIPPPVAVGQARIAGILRDGSVVHARGLRWHAGHLPAGDRLLSFAVAYEWLACSPSGGRCRPGGGTTATPFAASHYTVAHADTGRRLELVETATEVVETDAATFSFRVVRASRHVLAGAVAAAYPRGRAPATAFMNGLPPKSTGSTSERFTVSAPHWNAADGRPRLRYRIDGHAWRDVPRRKVVATGPLGLGSHGIVVRASNSAGRTTRRFAWRVVPLPAPVACQGTCWAPPHLDSTGHPMRWDWQIGRVAPLQRMGARAVDLYDIDGFLTTRAEVRALHTTWQASTLPHPRAACYLDLAWEDYRPDGTPSPNGFPAAALGRVYFGFPQERWVDMRRVAAVMQVFDARIAMCARKGFDAVEPDNINGWENNTGFPLTKADQLRYNRWIARTVHKAGMAVALKNDSRQAKQLVGNFDFAVVEECFQYAECDLYRPFIEAGKAVFETEYELPTSKFCSQAQELGFASIRKGLELFAKPWEPCVPPAAAAG